MTTLAPTSSIQEMPVETTLSSPVDFTKVNVFDQLAFLIRTVRLYLEGRSHSSQLPRYARILSINSTTNTEGLVGSITEGIKLVVTPISDGTVYAVHRLIDITLDAKDILRAADSLVAQVEAVLDLIEQIIVNELPKKLIESVSMGGLITSSELGELVLIGNSASISSSFNRVRNLLNIIPSEEDLDLLGHELYRLACIIHSEHGIDIQSTGKIRLLQFGFNAPWKMDYYTQGNGDPDIKNFGKALNPATNSGKVIYPGSLIKLFDTAAANTEAAKLLTELGYPQSGDALKHFQRVNSIEVTGEYNNETLNRFFNLDVRRQNLIRVKKHDGSTPVITTNFGYLKNIINHNADDPDTDRATVKQNGYKYYEIKSTNNEDAIGDLHGMGWHAVDSSAYIQGFVALESRKIKSNTAGKMFDGGTFSEGEAANGKFFFCARHTEPWIPGRGGIPANSIYDDSNKINLPKVSRMIQVVKIDRTIIQGATGEIQLTASALVRSLYNDKALVNGKQLPDQGRIGLTVFKKVGDSYEKLPDTDAKSEWFPDTSELSDAILKSRAIDYRNGWMLEKTPDIKFQTDQNSEIYIKISLEGKHNASWDIDAYFDEVVVEWRYVSQ